MIKAWICIACLFSSDLSEITDGSIRWRHHSGKKYDSTFVPLHRSLKRSFAFCFIMLWCASRNDRGGGKAVQQKEMKTQSTSFSTGGWKVLMMMMGPAAQQLWFSVLTEKKRCSCHKVSCQKWSFDVRKMRHKCQTQAAITQKVSDGRSEKTESRRKDVASANRKRPLYPVWSVCVSKQDEKRISLTKTISNQSPVSKIRRKGPNCANRADTYLEMWLLELALWTLHAQGEDKSNPLMS